MIDHWILEGTKPVRCETLEEWARWMESANRIVAQTRLPAGGVVSTAFSGIDHGFGSSISPKNHLPLLFETMYFDRDGNTDIIAPSGDIVEYQVRYATWTEAEQGHQTAVDLFTAYERNKRWLNTHKWALGLSLVFWFILIITRY